MTTLKGTQTERNLRTAFAGESQASRLYLYFAQQAESEGFREAAATFRKTAEGETGHVNGHLDYLAAVGDPTTGLPIGSTPENLRAAIAAEQRWSDLYPEMARVAREEGFEEIALWFETLAKNQRSHAGRFERTLKELET